MFAAIREEMLAGADAMLLIHGYNYTFRDAIGRAAQLKQWLETDTPAGIRARPLVMMAFSWPSLGGGVTPSSMNSKAKERGRRAWRWAGRC